MKRLMLTGILVLATGVSGMTAQKKNKKDQPATPAQQGQPAQAAQPKGPAPKSQGEAQALQALVQAQNDPEATIKAADELLTKFADTDFKGVALFMEARAYQQKGDAPKAQVFAERTVEADPKNFQATLLLGELIAQQTRENDLDREEKLGRAEKLINGTINDLKTAEKPNPQLTDQQWEEGKKALMGEGHNALGMMSMTRKKYDVAASEFKLAYEMDVQPAYEVRMASALQSSGKHDETVALCDKIMAEPNLHPQIRQVAQALRAAAIKAGAKNTTPPPAPAAK
jgi:tetratricopeptide (TPR) repeat protein